MRCDLVSKTDRVEYQRGLLFETDDGIEFEPYADQGSGNLASIVNTSGVGIVAADTFELPKGSPIEVERIPGAPVRRAGR